MIFFTQELDIEYLRKMEERSWNYFLDFIRPYYTKFEDIGVILKTFCFWENGSLVQNTRLPFKVGYTMYAEVYTFKDDRPICMAGGETDDLGYFTSILYIDESKKERGYKIYVNTEFEDLHKRLEEIYYNIKIAGYSCFDS